MSEFSGSIKVLEEKISKLMDVETEYKYVREELNSLLDMKRNLDIDKVSFDREIKNLKEVLNKLIEEIERKDKIKESITNLNDVRDFLDNYFMNVLDVMEKKVLLRVYNDFNELFKNWFSILIWDEGLKISLDDDFSPKIEQNGYDIDYEHLSGGEKTAAALAYRLALNQVINNLMSHVKTKDLLILDEPTDGFSDEQLDRMRDVLDELKVKQLIIVSHESKIESFVDSIIRLEKSNQFWALFFISLFFFFLRFPSMFEPYWYGDEGIFAAVAKNLTQGGVLYQTAWDNKPPMIYLTYAGIFSLFGVSMFWLRLVVAVVVMTTATVIYEIGRETIGKHRALVASFIFGFFTSLRIIEGNLALTEIFMILPISCAMYLALKGKFDNYSLFFAGALFFLESKKSSYIQLILPSIYTLNHYFL